MVKYKKYTTKAGKERWKYKGYWGIDYRTGKPIQPERQGFKSKKEAKLDYERTIASLNKQKSKVENKQITFEQLYCEFYEMYQHSGVTGSTVYNFDRAIKRDAFKFFKSVYIDTITVRECQQYLNSLRTRLKSFKYTYNCTRTVFDYAVQIGYITDNPFAKIKLKFDKREYKQREIPRNQNVYDSKQLITFLDFCEQALPYHQFAFFRLLAFAGLRKSEALALKLSDLDYSNMSINISKTIAINSNASTIVSNRTKTKHSNDEADVVFLDEETFKILKTHIKSNFGGIIPLNIDTYIFQGKKRDTHLSRNAPNDWLVQLWKKHGNELTELGLHKINPHGFRHTQASLLYELGVSPKDAQHRLRHSNLKTTMDTYTHLSKNKELQTVAILNEFQANK